MPQAGKRLTGDGDSSAAGEPSSSSEYDGNGWVPHRETAARGALGDCRLGRKIEQTRQKRRNSEATASAERETSPGPVAAEPAESRASLPLVRRFTTALAVAGLLALHLALAERSLVQENPTVDEVVHLPAGITYWQRQTFKLYHHNPPLVRMVAALPVLWANPVTAPVYEQGSWTSADPSPTTFSQTFAFVNQDRYFDLFRLARMVMPLFSIVGGLAVFAWSRRLYGSLGGLLSLALWVFCPNILAHCRLVTTDVGSTAVGVAATFVFWLYLHKPSWRWAVAAGILLGLAQLTKFSMLLLYAVWPFLWLVRLLLVTPRRDWLRGGAVGLAHGLLIVVLSILTIDAGYLFEGVGKPLGRYEFASMTLTRPVAEGVRKPPATKNPAYAILWPFRENRFRGSLLETVPALLPEHYLLGFDEQKIEADGFPNRYRRAFDALNAGDIELAGEEAGSSDQSVAGYPVYLDGEMRRSGWWDYYFRALLYKVPEGTWLLVLWSVLLLVIIRRSREAWADEVCLWTVPVAVLLSMSFLTNINLGLRYVLSIAPYVFIAAGNVAPWIEGLSGKWKRIGRGFVLVCLGSTVSASLLIYPHYLAYFNWVSGGPRRVPAHLIDSNLDWGQDLVGLREWVRAHAPGQPIGLAYFGQINPSMFPFQRDPFDWFLPPVMPGSTVMMERTPGLPPPRLVGPMKKLIPGYYAVSATLVYGLPWRLYDPSPAIPDAWAPAWNAGEDAFSYFRKLTPSDYIGNSIYIYNVKEKDIERVQADLRPDR
jgi:4-amino-4-deoxy-L-arabinose transferase-like glycosyltransferase